MTNLKQDELISEIKNALRSVKYGSVEIIVQDSTVTQITVRNIKKTSVGIHEEEQVVEENPFKNRIQTRNKIRINLHS